MIASSVIYGNESLGHACFFRPSKYCMDFELFDTFYTAIGGNDYTRTAFE